MMKRLVLIPVAAMLALPTLSRADQPADLTLSFDVASREGAVMVALYSSEAAYRSAGEGRREAIVIGAGPVRVEFKGLRPGRYAAQAFQDVDRDGALDSNPFGYPTEPYGFSNGAAPHMGPPAWSDAAFEVKPGANSHTIALRTSR
jgi:uncharacterized protein (DUF2141 family)